MKITRLYEGIYDQYQSKDYQGVIVGVDSAVAQNPDDALVPKFMYIKALSVGALMGKEEMKTELDSLIAHYPPVKKASRHRS